MIESATSSLTVPQSADASTLDTLVVKHDADLKGKRVVTTVPVRKGDVIARLRGHREVYEPTRYTVQTGVHTHIDGLKQLTFMNHSCAPSAFLNTTAMTLTALRDLNAGDEVTFFYPSTEWHMAEPFACLCGAAECVSLVAGAELMPAHVLARYDINEHIRVQRADLTTATARGLRPDLADMNR